MSDPEAGAYTDGALPLADRITDLLARLTLEEKVALLHQHQPAIDRLGVGPFRTGTEALHGLAWLGEATVFPQAVGLGATWDLDLVRRVGEAVGDEVRGLHHRTPSAPASTCGRRWSTSCATRAGAATRRATPRTRC
ncbi:glycoside hydrolase family 3 N-terminal domain-containing protein [Luedemannella flava]